MYSLTIMTLNLVTDTDIAQSLDTALQQYQNSDCAIKKLDYISDLAQTHKCYVLAFMSDLNDLPTIQAEITKDTKLFIVTINDIDIDYDSNKDIFSIWTIASLKAIPGYLHKTLANLLNLYYRNLNMNLLQTLIDSAPDMVWFKDIEENHVILNKEFGSVVNKAVVDCLNKKHPDIWGIPWDEYESSDFACRVSEAQVINQGFTGEFKEQVQTSGGMRQVTTYKTPLYGEFGDIIGTCGIGRDVTDLSNLGIELDLLIEAIPYPTVLCDENYDILKMNNAASAILQLQDNDVVNYKTWCDFIFKIVPERQSTEGSVYVNQQTSNDTYYSFIKKAIRDNFNNVTGYICILRDVTYQCLYHDVMFKAANIDTLTGAYNRHYFYDYINNLKGCAVTMLYLDLDNFKSVNDTYTHSKGDEVLCGVTKLFQNAFPTGTVIRLGGDEFIILLQGKTNYKTMKPTLHQLNKEVQLLSPGKDCVIGASIGYVSTSKLEDVESFIKECDTLMYNRKKKHHKSYL